MLGTTVMSTRKYKLFWNIKLISIASDEGCQAYELDSDYNLAQVDTNAVVLVD